MRAWLFEGIVVVFALLALPAAAQQGIQYDAIANPYLFLLREPAVWADLKLTEKQKESLTSLNARVDGPLLAMRNMPNEAADKRFVELLSETQRGVSLIFDRDQQQRVTQIVLRVRGIECLLDDRVADALQTSSTQRDAMQEIIKKAQTGIAALREQAQAGKPREPLEKEYVKLRTDEQKDLLAQLTARQKEQFVALLGRNFDLSKIGKVAFKAPEFSAGGQWINSKPLRIEQLRGKVVALHYWTFG